MILAAYEASSKLISSIVSGNTGICFADTRSQDFAADDPRVAETPPVPDTPPPGFLPTDSYTFPPGYSPISISDRWPVIVIGTVEKDLGTVRAPRPLTEDWETPIMHDWAEVEVNVERVLKGEVPERIMVRRLVMPPGGGAGCFHLLRPGERVLFFLEGTGDGSEAFRISPWEISSKVSLASKPPPDASTKVSVTEIIQMEIAHGLAAGDAYVVHEVMDALLNKEFFSDEAVATLTELAKSPDPWLSLHAVCLLALRGKDAEALKEVIRRAEAGDYTGPIGVLAVDGEVTIDIDRAFYRGFNPPRLWIEDALAGATYPDAVPVLLRLVESGDTKAWLRCVALETLSAFCEELRPETWWIALGDPNKGLQYMAVDRMRIKFCEHPMVSVSRELKTKVSQEDFEKDPEKYVRMWLDFLDVLEAEQAAAVGE